MDLADWVNQEAISLWREYQNTFNIQEDVLLPLIYPPIKKSTLLFVGLNPSSNIEGLNDILFGTGLCPNNLRNFYSLNNIDNFDLQLAQKIERCSRERYPYFQRFDCISKYTKLSWEHIDLFFYRLTGQNRLKHKIFNDMNGFWDRQLALSKTLICKSAPIIIVVQMHLEQKFLRRSLM